MKVRVNGRNSKLAGLFGGRKGRVGVADMDLDKLVSDAALKDAAKHAKVTSDRQDWVDHFIAWGKQEIELENKPRLVQLRRAQKSLTAKWKRLVDVITACLSGAAPSKAAVWFWGTLTLVLALYGVGNAYVPLYHYLGKPAVFMALSIGVVVLIAMHFSLRGFRDKTLRRLALIALLACLIGHGALALFRADMFAAMVQQWQTVDPAARQELALKVYADEDVAWKFTCIMLLFTLATELTAGLCFLRVHCLLAASPRAARQAQKELPGVEVELADVDEEITRFENEPELWEAETRLVFLCQFGTTAVPQNLKRRVVIETVRIKPNGGLR